MCWRAAAQQTLQGFQRLRRICAAVLAASLIGEAGEGVELRCRADGTGGRTRLWSVDLTGYNEREILTPIDASDPAWSPLSPLN